MKTEHTPGPWEFSHSDQFGQSFDVWHSGTSRTLFKSVHTLPIEEQEANCKLIASAPALLAENERLREALTDAEFLMRKAGKIPGPMQDSFNRSAEDARAALAEGGAR